MVDSLWKIGLAIAKSGVVLTGLVVFVAMCDKFFCTAFGMAEPWSYTAGIGLVFVMLGTKLIGMLKNPIRTGRLWYSGGWGLVTETIVLLIVVVMITIVVLHIPYPKPGFELTPIPGME